MELTKNFEPGPIEERLYRHWTDMGFFNSLPDDREAYTIVMPPPNVTGVLHMGHCLNNTIQDILIRRARMQGKNACWVPGTDHASIATEAKVVGMLRERGIAKSSLSRDEFLGYAWEWKEKYGGIILEQLKKMGCSLDWNRTAFTMDPDYYDSVIKVFIDLFERGFIYRGKRMINWDVKAKTALSDEEVIRKETKQKLYYVRYEVVDENEGRAQSAEDRGPGAEEAAVQPAANGQRPTANESITIATVRPETIMGDAAIAVNPADERYKNLVGKHAIVPLINRRVPIIADEYVTSDFGTGALKVTPAHDINDFRLGEKHRLEVIDVFNDDGTMSEAAQIYVGEERFAVRKKIAAELEEKGFIEKTEEYTSEVGYSERTDVAVEPRLSLQWWVSMEKLAEPALRAVMDEQIKFFPPKFKNLYRHWMENIKDWCISRQLWWGHRIPAWYDEQGNFYVAKNENDAREKARKNNPDFSSNSALTQDEDCLDTWFSSWLWPFEVFKGMSEPGNAELKYYYPTQTLVTAPEIIFFWVARMVMAGYQWQNEKPFDSVYFTGIVRDKQGRKMSKSLGNSPDLLALIEQYGADAVRFGIMIASPAGNDILFDESSLEQGRNFNNKMWNALKLIKMWEGRVHADELQRFENTDNTENSTHHPGPESHNQFAIRWFNERLNAAATEVEELMQQFKLSEALKVLYSLIWDDFCSWYLEWVKPGFEQSISAEVYEKTVEYYGRLLQLLHPFMPFITEEIFSLLSDKNSDLMMTRYSQSEQADASFIESGELLKNAITALRDARVKNNLKPKEQIALHLDTTKPELFEPIAGLLTKQINSKPLQYSAGAPANTIAVVFGAHRFYIESEMPIDTAGQKESLQKELTHLQNFLAVTEKKLSNEKFVANAKPEIIALERKKKADASEKIALIEANLQSL